MELSLADYDMKIKILLLSKWGMIGTFIWRCCYDLHSYRNMFSTCSTCITDHQHWVENNVGNNPICSYVELNYYIE